ncbi:F-actin-capping protein subunit alpha [Scheffersomyces spartinae]|uniref:F-actin-capping protein subunit alpha n=1 Tax=Scheffersomyces spartinae TaxID=45513 RepID=A0A9P8AH00_9ASCO|nr:F-actin-capping protein subunit alpha [Scheffersomyces spartinae]KAG7192178.1 F-actin-capping protein subunit alpha [Scheffersomyces spartinae]
MASKIEDVVASLVSSAPPGELSQAATDLGALLSGRANQSIINTALESYATEEGAIVAGNYVISKHSKLAGSTKYIDYVSGKAFNVDLKANKVLDVEDHNVSDKVSSISYFDSLVKALNQYGEDHFPSLYAFNVIPDGSDLHIIIVGQRVNPDNFYTGQWRSHYVVSQGKDTINGDVSLDIHYYEDGNVRLTFGEKLKDTTVSENASAIVNAIDEFESTTSMTIVGKFEELNQKSFKNLRRLLPVTRSKIQWGKAIGNYRLGSDVVNKK